MPWQSPSLKQVRSLVRDYIAGNLPGADASVPNSVMRVLSDATGATCHLTLQYVDWLSLQLLPDSSESQWLDRHGTIWLTNADGSTGRKTATRAGGTITLTSIAGSPIVVPASTVFSSNTNWDYESTIDVTLAPFATADVTVRALDPGAGGNLDPGSPISPAVSIPGISGQATVVTLTGGTDQETDDELRLRVLDRIRQPPMGGDANDYVQWALSYPGVTRAWCSPLEMGMGTVSVRFMMDDLRATDDPMTNGFPFPDDVTAVYNYLNTKRPVAVKDFVCVAPIPEPIDFTVSHLNQSDATTYGAIIDSVTAMLYKKAAPAYALNGVAQPAQMIYSAWVSEAVLQTAGVEYFDLTMADHPMPTAGSLAVMGTATWI
jgi:uncharacterized phage protein gp47/JayE